MAGYGNDPDAWRVADTARRIASENKYSASRLPGFPVQEIICSFLWTGGPFALNSVTALFSALSVSFFSFIMKFYGSRDYVLGSFAFAFTPVIYINSTNSMDYLWALAFILGSFYFVLIRKPLVAGLFLGIAIGCRVTSVAMFVPLFLLLISQEPNDFNHRDRLTFFLGTFFVSIFVYLPVFLRYGTHRFAYPGIHFPWVLDIFYKASIMVWGCIGSLALFVVILSRFFRNSLSLKESSISKSLPVVHIRTWIITISLYSIIFFLSPLESGYLIPIIPFILLLLGRTLERRIFHFLCIALLLSPIFLGMKRSDLPGGEISSDLALKFNIRNRQLVLDLLNGPIFSDYWRRVERMVFTERVISRGNFLGEKTVIVAGWLYPEIRVAMPSDPSEGVEYVELLNESQLKNYINQDYQVYFLPGQRNHNFNVCGIDLKEFGALPLLPDEEL